MGNKKLGEIRKDFSQNTSCHGLAQVYASTNRYQRIFWGLITLAVFGVLVSMLVIRINEYNEHKTTTTFSEKYMEELDFPAITICNFNNFFGIKDGEEREAVDELAKAKASELHFSEIDLNKIKYFDDVYNGSIRNFAEEKGWQLDEETLIYCFTQEDICVPENFTHTITDLGKCWTFKHPPTAIRAGSRHGISIVFNVHQDKYSENVYWGNWESGIKVQIHPPYDVPEVDQLGLAVPVGHMAFISVSKREEKIMYKPWGECEPDNEELNLYDTYSRSNCFNECFRNELEEYCGCRMYHFEDLSSEPECTPKETVDCLVNISVITKRYLTPTNCGCQPPCKSTVYTPSISYAKLPNPNVQDAINGGEVSDLAGITVYFERMSYTLQEESKAITRTGLLSDLGGQLGLWIGISFVTLFEFIQFVILYCVESVETVRRRRRRSLEKSGGERNETDQTTIERKNKKLGETNENFDNITTNNV